MPIMAVNTIREVTLGLHREKKLLKLRPIFFRVATLVLI